MSVTTTSPSAVAHTGANDVLHRAGIALRGIIAIALGCLAIYYSTNTTLLIGAFGIFALIDGIARLIIALRSTGRDKAWLIHGLEGLVGIALGIVTFRFVGDLIALTWTIAEWSFGIGALTIVFAGVTWGRLRDAWLWMLAGIVLIALGVALLWYTRGGLRTPGIAVGLGALVYGIVSLGIAVRTQHHRA